MAIQIQGVSKSFVSATGEDIQVLAEVSMQIKKQEFFSIVGPSGCGKSTIFNIIAGLLKPTNGKVIVCGEEIDQTTGHVGYMMQKDLLLPWRSILDNVTLGLEVKGLSKKDRGDIAMDYLDRYGLASFAGAYPSTLSGGMRQRVALIRTLVTQPDIILLDEPFSALDYQTRLILEDEILSILKSEGKTGVLITHDIEEAIAISDRIAVMSRRPTTVKQVYDIGLASQYGSALKARSDQKFKQYFESIWSELDIQMGRIS
ncbi:ABC transporter ATP-binding protein [Paenibacillus amylolyticus]|uniref:ABC transporter ATP-binding protein n=1 Tax=Paenibacillus amylolyticus TaxID=1451 RepID=UPI001059ECBE|nr:ABC transporter ATP-binding protein [Paenibacillus amylolyticus]TDL70577.1 ABC transporter ATP-binding protein [Paenibacillus amylolyticus]